MNLYVQFTDTWNAYHEMMMGFEMANKHKRVKKIKLTDEQIKELQPKCIGSSGGKEIFEEVSVLCIQED